jgi:hypothetical protein
MTTIEQGATVHGTMYASSQEFNVDGHGRENHIAHEFAIVRPCRAGEKRAVCGIHDDDSACRGFPSTRSIAPEKSTDAVAAETGRVRPRATRGACTRRR